ncbi:MAG: C25 family cysteine peptidase [Bacteroidota bacterium]|nr:C25 family cysteine peptidase [Bacteroidota bacterium]
MHHLVPRSLFYVFLFSILAANVTSAQISARRLAEPARIAQQRQKSTVQSKLRVRPLGQKVRTRVFGSNSTSEFFHHRTTSTSTKTRITFDINLGEPISTRSDEKVSSAVGKQFGKMCWSNLRLDKLPAGTSVVYLGKPGEPEVPALSVVIAIPDDAKNISSIFERSISQNVSNIFLLPRPDAQGNRVFEQKSYLATLRAAPILSAPAKIRTMRIVSLTIPLVQFDAASGSAKTLKKFTCGVTFDRAAGLSAAPLAYAKDPVFEKMYSLAAANTSDIARFRSGFHSRSLSNRNLPASITPTFDRTITNWIDPSAPYVKLSATRTGLYRVTPTEIGSRGGGDISGWRQSEVRMFNKGREVPVWIDSTSDGRINAIEYYGERLAGYPGEYLNWDSDSNAYWLTNSRKFQTLPLRYTDKVIAGNPSLTLSEANVILHHEQDNFYYGGDAGRDDATLHRCEWVAGERFVWQYLPTRHNNTDVLSITDSFSITALPSSTAGKFAQVVVFLRGVSTSNGVSVTHKASVLINGLNVGDLSFVDYQDLYDTITIPLSSLKAGVNQFELDYVTGAGTPDKWYFDYYAISLPAAIAPSSDTAIAKGQWAFSLTPSASQFTIALQTLGDVPHVFDLSDGSRLIPSGLVYKDAGSGTLNYVAATTASFLHPDRIVNATGTFAAILDTLSGADYIVITHPLFSKTAQLLALQRQKFGLRTKVVTTDDVYNAFNFGSDEPWAIRRYLQYAYDFYAGPPPAFVTLFGDGTWDPKANLNNPLQDESVKTIHRSFVPTFGVPNSDYIYTTAEGVGMPDSETFRMVISRIPVESVEEGENFLDKLIEYESSTPAPWNKNFLFIAGGDAPFQYGILLNYEHAYVGDSIAPGNANGGLGNPPVSINPTFVYRHDLINQIDITQIPAIQQAFSDGQALVYFFGHGAPNITDIQFPDVGTLRNTGTYPVFISVSCRTGAFAEPNLISMNESFVRVKEAGAILAYGTTGFGDVSYDFNMSARGFNYLRGDSADVRMSSTGAHKVNYPLILTFAKFIESVVQPWMGTFTQHNSLYEYSILGDAAMGFDLRPQPEFNITASDITLSGKDGTPRTVFSVNDSQVTVKATIRNFGFGITSPVHVRITDEQPGNRQIGIIDTIETLENLATTGAVFSLDSFAVGSNTLRIFVDYDNQFAETNENDNEASVSFLVNGNSGTPFYPPEGSKYFCDIRTDSVNFILLLPANVSGPTSVELQFDTTSAFNSGVLRDFPGMQGSGLFFQRAFARTVLPNPSSHVLWWRSRVLLPSGVQSGWQAQSLSLEAPKPAGARSEFSYTTGDQLASTIISGLEDDPADGALFIPLKDTVRYEVEARGLLDTNVQGSGLPVGLFLINGKSKETRYINGQFVALTLHEMTADSSGIEQTFEFLKTDNDSIGKILADSLVAVINGIPDGRRVIALTNFAPLIPSFSYSPKVTQALQSLGSLNGMNTLSTFGSYALIGRKGLAPGQAKEKFSPDRSAGVSLFDTMVVFGTSGLAQTPLTAVATGYGKLKWNAQNIATGSTIKFIVLGERKNSGVIDTVIVADASQGTSADISFQPALFDNKLFVQMNFQRGSASSVSPRLTAIELEYDAAPEFNTGDSLISVSPKTVLEGNPVTVTYRIENTTCIDAQRVPVQLVQNFHGNSVVLATDTIANFPGHSSASFSHSIPTSGFQGNVNLTATVNPGGVLNEQLLFNNSANTSYTVARDSTKPRLDMVFDGRHINSGDYVSSKVEIGIRLSDNSPLRVADSAAISGILQALFGTKGPIVFSGTIKNDTFATKFTTQPTGTIQATLDITPLTPLEAGRYLFTAMGHDASGNRADTISDEFVVSSTNGLDHVMNYPNPFKDKTWFTFILKAGSQADVKVVIYTVAGRKIRTLHLDPSKQRTGLNSVEWDGRDEVGNDVANGTYLYRVVLNGTNDDGSPSSDATTERAVRSR